MIKLKEMFNRTRRPHNAMIQAAKITHVSSAGIYLICGILIMAIAQFAQPTLFVLVGIACVLIGGAGILGYFSNDVYRLAFQSDFALGIFTVVVGALMIVMPDNLFVLLPCAIAIVAILDGSNKSQISFEGYQFGLSAWFMVLISGIVELGLGVALIVLATRGYDARIWIGITMAVIGGVNVWTTMYMVRCSTRTQELKVENVNTNE